MNRLVAVAAVCFLLLGAMWRSPDLRSLAQEDGTPRAAQVPASPVVSEDSSLAPGLPEGVAFDELASGTVEDARGDLLILERLTFDAGSELEDQETSGPEILFVEQGTVLVADAFGIESPLDAGQGVLLRDGAEYTVAQDGGTPASVLRVRIGAEDAEAAMPATSGVEVETLVDGDIDSGLSDATFFLARTVWALGADTAPYTQSGPLGFFVEAGELSVTSPSGLEGQIGDGRGVVLPADMPLRLRNAGTNEAEVLVFGLVPPAVPLFDAIEPDPTPTVPPTLTPVPTATTEPTPTVAPTETPAPTATVAPSPTVAPTLTPEPTATTMPTLTPTPRPTQTPAPTATPTPAPGSVLYEADWSDGLNGWSGSSDWTTLDGMLLSDGNSESGEDITAPFHTSAIPNFAVEVEIQVVRVDENDRGCNGFGFAGRFTNVDDLVSTVQADVAMADCQVQGRNQAQPVIDLQVAAEGEYTRLTSVNFDPGSEWRSYRLELEGNSITLLIDGILLLEAVDNQVLSGDQLRLWSHGVQLNVRSYRIIAL